MECCIQVNRPFKCDHFRSPHAFIKYLQIIIHVAFLIYSISVHGEDIDPVLGLNIWYNSSMLFMCLRLIITPVILKKKQRGLAFCETTVLALGFFLYCFILLIIFTRPFKAKPEDRVVSDYLAQKDREGLASSGVFLLIQLVVVIYMWSRKVEEQDYHSNSSEEIEVEQVGPRGITLNARQLRRVRRQRARYISSVRRSRGRGRGISRTVPETARMSDITEHSESASAVSLDKIEVVLNPRDVEKGLLPTECRSLSDNRSLPHEDSIYEDVVLPGGSSVCGAVGLAERSHIYEAVGLAEGSPVCGAVGLSEGSLICGAVGLAECTIDPEYAEVCLSDKRSLSKKGSPMNRTLRLTKEMFASREFQESLSTERLSLLERQPLSHASAPKTRTRATAKEVLDPKDIETLSTKRRSLSERRSLSQEGFPISRNQEKAKEAFYQKDESGSTKRRSFSDRSRSHEGLQKDKNVEIAMDVLHPRNVEEGVSTKLLESSRSLSPKDPRKSDDLSNTAESEKDKFMV